MLRFMAVVSGLCLVASCLLRGSLAQTADIHVVPREMKHAEASSDGGEIADPALRTHTKPLQKDVDLVLVPVTVTDPVTRVVTGLGRDSFIVKENGQLQQIRYFSTDDAPISLGVILDLSGSMKDKIEQARQAVIDFFRTANPEDEFFLLTFSDRPQLMVNFTSSVDEIQQRLGVAIPDGCTSLLDAIYLAVNQMRAARNQRKALLIISDGGDNHSRYTEDETLDMVREADVQIYAMGLSDFHPSTPEELHGPQLLGAITDATGGQTYFIHSARQLPEVATKIGMELRNEYLLGYRPTNTRHDGKWRKIRVKVDPPKGLPTLHVYAKAGYYATAE